MDSYRVSKAWHISHELADAIRSVIRTKHGQEADLAGKLRVSSVKIPYHIVLASGKTKLKKDKLQHFNAARDAVDEFIVHLHHAKRTHYIEASLHENFSKQALEARKLIAALIYKLNQEA